MYVSVVSESLSTLHPSTVPKPDRQNVVHSMADQSKAPARRGPTAVRLAGPPGKAPNAELGSVGGTDRSWFTDGVSIPASPFNGPWNRSVVSR